MALDAWRDLCPVFDRMIDRAPVLREVFTIATDLAAMGVLGLEALSYLATGVAPPDGWRETSLASIDRASVPRADVELVVVLPLRKLVVAAAELPQLGTLAPRDWKARVDTLAAPPPPPRR